MTSSQIAETVAHAVALDQTIADLQIELTVLKERLTQQAEHCLRKEVPDAPTFEGCSFTFTDEQGHAARVIFPNPKLITSFWLHDGRAFRTKEKIVHELPGLTHLAGKAFAKLFRTQYKTTHAFRELAPALLGEKKGNSLIALCSEPSSPRVAFETKEKP